MNTIPVVALAICFAAHAVHAQSLKRIDIAPVIGGAVLVSQLASRVQHDLILTLGIALALWRRRTSTSLR